MHLAQWNVESTDFSKTLKWITRNIYSILHSYSNNGWQLSFLNRHNSLYALDFLISDDEAKQAIDDAEQFYQHIKNMINTK